MNRVAWFIICTVVGLELIGWGLLAPAHLRAIDARVLERRGAAGLSLVDEGLSLVNVERIGPARLFLAVAERTSLSGRERLAEAIRKFEAGQPRLAVWGSSAPYLERLFDKKPLTSNPTSQPVIDWLLRQDTRDTLLDALRHSRRPGVLDVLRTRELTNTVVFAPATSAAGDPLDAAIVTTALLLQQDFIAENLRTSLEALVAGAINRGAVEPLELFYLDVLALGKRLDWGQLVDVMRLVPDDVTFREAATLVRDRESDLPVVYSAMHLAESPHPVTKYLAAYPASGIKDLTFALHSGGAALQRLLDRQVPVHYPAWRDKVVAFTAVRVLYEPLARVTTNQPVLGFVVKYVLCLLGALLIARAITYLSPVLVQEIVENRPVVTGPQVVIGLCLLFVVLFFSESLVTRVAGPRPEFPLRVKFPVATAALRVTIPHQVHAMIDKASAVSLLIFFILQAAIFVFCRMKLAEIRRQSLPSRLKLRLLENEEHLFDAGLYFGFVGTVISLILVSLGVMQVGLMSAYSSTSFGIIFVSILKIFHVRPYRRRLILEAEMAEREPQPA